MEFTRYLAHVAVPRQYLTQIFDLQVSKLRNKGITVPSVDKLRKKIPKSVTVSDSAHFSLMLILPFETVPFQQQLEAVDLGYKITTRKSYTFLDPDRIIDTRPSIPKEPYLIFDVEDGGDTLGLSPFECEEGFSKMEDVRFAVNVSQGLAMVIYRPEILRSHYIHLSGSRILDEKTCEPYVPDFWIYGQRLKMKRDAPDDADDRWGTPSYGKIVHI